MSNFDMSVFDLKPIERAPMETGPKVVGDSRSAVYAALTHSWQTCLEVSAVSKINDKTVNQWLRKFALDEGVAERIPDESVEHKGQRRFVYRLKGEGV